MNTGLRQSFSVRPLLATIAAVLLMAPMTSQAQNTATGTNALGSNTTGSGNTADGYDALFSNTTGSGNTATGLYALFDNITGSYNTANGVQALVSNTTGNQNTANGWSALYHNTTGYDNTASGLDALENNTTGNANTANGYYALVANTKGYSNTADGVQALYANMTGSYNVANGVSALFSNITGSNNIALGYCAGYNITTGRNNIAIGNQGLAADSGVIRIGTTGAHTATYVAGISGVTASGGVEVYINPSGQLGTILSSRRFKNDIHDMGTVSEKLMNLRPVTFRYKDSAEKGAHHLQYGLIAEEVAKVYPDMVQYDKAGKPFTVYYHLLTPMLLNELQKAHRQSEAQKAEIMAIDATHKAEIASLKSELAALKQSQQQQFAALAKLTALVQTSQNREPLQRAVYTQH